jgi:large subunit ribosomal protein L25
MAIIELSGELREDLGKGESRQIRREGYIPAVLYGANETPTPVKIESRAFHRLMRTPGGLHSVIDFKLPGRSDVMALVREIQRDPLSREILHVDFQHIEAGKPVHVTVPIVLTGTPAGVREGGVLEFVSREIEVKCLPRHIPGRWEVDVSALSIGNSIHASDLQIPGVELLTDPGRTIAIVVAPTVIAEPTPAEVGAEGAPAAEGEEAEAKPEEEPEEGRG